MGSLFFSLALSLYYNNIRIMHRNSLLSHYASVSRPTTRSLANLIPPGIIILLNEGTLTALEYDKSNKYVGFILPLLTY